MACRWKVTMNSSSDNGMVSDCCEFLRQPVITWCGGLAAVGPAGPEMHPSALVTTHETRCCSCIRKKEIVIELLLS